MTTRAGRKSTKRPSAKKTQAKKAKNAKKAKPAKKAKLKTSAAKKPAPAKKASAAKKRAPSKKLAPTKQPAPTKPVASGGPARIAAAEAAPYLEGRVRGDWYERIDLHAGSHSIDGDLSLDDAERDAIVVNGDLTVRGSIVNRDGDVGVALVVTGNLRAENLVAAGAEIVVGGDLLVDGFVFGFYNHGSVTVHGATRAQAIITEYHAFDLRGPVTGVTVGGRGRVTAHDATYAAAIAPELLTREGGYPDHDLTTRAILDARPVLRARET